MPPSVLTLVKIIERSVVDQVSQDGIAKHNNLALHEGSTSTNHAVPNVYASSFLNELTIEMQKNRKEVKYPIRTWLQVKKL